MKPFNVNWELIWDLLMLIVLKPFSNKWPLLTISSISQNILNLWMRLIFPETRHLGFQFKHKNETIPIGIEADMIFQSWLYRLLQQLQENRTLLAFHFHQPPHLIHQISSKAKMRSKFMILCQLSLNGSNYSHFRLNWFQIYSN